MSQAANRYDPITGEDWMKARIERLEALNKYLEQLVYCQIGLTWKSVALDRLNIIQNREEENARLREKLQVAKTALMKIWTRLEEK